MVAAVEHRLLHRSADGALGVLVIEPVEVSVVGHELPDVGEAVHFAGSCNCVFEEPQHF